MKFFDVVIFSTALLFWGCSGDLKRSESRNEQMALGWLQREDFMTAQFPEFEQAYDTITVGSEFVEMIRLLGHDAEYLVVLGTWCSDSKREVPRFLKIADLAGIAPERIKYYGVDRTKKGPGEVAEQHQIELVPTIIVFKNGVEIGRIVETPKGSVEEDLLAILAGAHNR